MKGFSPFIVSAFVEADDEAGAPVLDFLMQFTDVPQDAAYTEAIRWASANSIVLGNEGAETVQRVWIAEADDTAGEEEPSPAPQHQER